MARNDSRFTTELDQLGAKASSNRANDLAASVADSEFDLEELDREATEADSEEEKFLRAPRRVPVRKTVTKKTATRLRWVFVGIAGLALSASAAYALVDYSTHSWRFRINGSDDIQAAGLTHVTRAQIMDVMGADIGRSIFKVDLNERKRRLEEIPWVESATVMRLLPGQVRIQIIERVPVAFVRIGSRVSLIDSGGVIMELPVRALSAYSFPVITGMGESEPLSTRAVRMHTYAKLAADLDAGGANYSKDLSEVDLSDPDDVKITVDDPQGTLVIHLGESAFLERYRIYLKHVQEWRQQFQKLESVDLRYSGQIIVNPDLRAPQRVNP
jgi:cell division protein FtsQ